MHDTLEKFFASLNGTWNFTRSITGNNPATANGIATFTAQNAQEYNFHEEGELHLSNGQNLDFFRSYVYRLTENYLDVLYRDGPQAGDHYQSYTFDEQQQKLLPLSTHICSADCYRGMYDVIDDDHFTLETTVKGPHKDYTIHTAFTRG